MSVYKYEYRLKSGKYESYVIYAHLMSNEWKGNKNYYELFCFEDLYDFLNYNEFEGVFFSFLNMTRGDLMDICEYYGERKRQNTKKVMNNIRKYLTKKMEEDDYDCI